MTTDDSDLILGIGNDIIEIERIRKSIQNHGERLLKRLFTAKERDYCLKYRDPVPHFAGRFSAKEAIAKAFGTGLGKQISWHEIEILNDPLGKPCVCFSSAIQERFQRPRMLISISHCQHYATAMAIWLRENHNRCTPSR